MTSLKYMFKMNEESLLRSEYIVFKNVLYEQFTQGCPLVKVGINLDMICCHFCRFTFAKPISEKGINRLFAEDLERSIVDFHFFVVTMLACVYFDLHPVTMSMRVM